LSNPKVATRSFDQGTATMTGTPSSLTVTPIRSDSAWNNVSHETADRLIGISAETTNLLARAVGIGARLDRVLPIYRGRSGVPDPELQRRQRLAVGRGGRGRSQVRHTLAAPGFLVKHLGQVIPRPTTLARSIAIPIVNTNPNVTQRKPSNVRQAMVCV
jgi:hypothetical protein